MRTIGLVSGSSRVEGSTRAALGVLRERWARALGADTVFTDGPDLSALPLFSPARLAAGRPREVEAWATFVKTADVIVVATPEYAHNIPAALKSAFEWLVASGEFAGRHVLAVTVTPASPRGERAMQSLSWTLRALDAAVLAELALYVTAAEARTSQGDSTWLALVDAAAELLP